MKFLALSLFSITFISAKSRAGTDPIDLLDATHPKGSRARVITDPRKPILVDDVAYFWGTGQYSSEKIDKGCAELETVNGHVTICLAGMQKCTHRIDDILTLIGDKVMLESGVSSSHLFWLCPEATSCGRLKCDAPVATQTPHIVMWSFIVLGVALLHIFCSIRTSTKQTEVEEMEKRIRS